MISRRLYKSLVNEVARVQKGSFGGKKVLVWRNDAIGMTKGNASCFKFEDCGNQNVFKQKMFFSQSSQTPGLEVIKVNDENFAKTVKASKTPIILDCQAT